MSAPTNPTEVAFTTGNGATPQTISNVPPYWRTAWFQNNTSVVAYVTTNGSAASSAGTTAGTIAIPPGGAVIAGYMEQPLPNNNLTGSNAATYYNGGGDAGSSGESTPPLDQSGAVNWTPQLAAATGQVGSVSVVLSANPAANSNVTVGWQ